MRDVRLVFSSMKMNDDRSEINDKIDKKIKFYTFVCEKSCVCIIQKFSKMKKTHKLSGKISQIKCSKGD